MKKLHDFEGKKNAENNEYDISIYQSVRYLVLDKQTNLNKLIQDYNSKLTKELFINKFELCKQMRITMDKDIYIIQRQGVFQFEEKDQML